MSDEYDFMEDADIEEGNTRSRRSDKRTRLKYMDMLQQVADRKKSHITIELDDLRRVGAAPSGIPAMRSDRHSMKKALKMRTA